MLEGMPKNALVEGPIVGGGTVRSGGETGSGGGAVVIGGAGRIGTGLAGVGSVVLGAGRGAKSLVCPGTVCLVACLELVGVPWGRPACLELGGEAGSSEKCT